MVWDEHGECSHNAGDNAKEVDADWNHAQDIDDEGCGLGNRVRP
jgi:hypothetical protein